MELGIIIVSWNIRDLLAACLESALADIERSGLAAKVWVVDNASTDGSAAMVRERFPQIQLIANDHNPGFAAANNQALIQSSVVGRQSSDTPFAALLLNPDTVVKAGALRTMVEFMKAMPRAGVVGAKLLNPDGSLQDGAFDFPGFTQALFDLFPPPGPLARLTRTRLNGRYPDSLFAAGRPFRIGHPLGAALMARAEAIRQVGLMDEGYHMYCEEIDWCWRMAEAGWEAYCLPQAEVIHYGAQSTGQIKYASLVNLWRARRRMYERHRGRAYARAVGRLVELAMRRRSAAAHRAHRAGQLSAAALAERLEAFDQIAGMWQG